MARRGSLAARRAQGSEHARCPSRATSIERSDFTGRAGGRLQAAVARRGSAPALRSRHLKCDEVVKDPATGAVVELRCSLRPLRPEAARSSGRKVKGTIHWVRGGAVGALRSAHLRPALRRPQRKTRPRAELPGQLEPGFAAGHHRCAGGTQRGGRDAGERYQFERQGYFVADMVDSRPDAPVFNRIVALRQWNKTRRTKSTDEESGGRTYAGPRPRKVVVGTVSGGTGGGARRGCHFSCTLFPRYQAGIRG